MLLVTFDLMFVSSMPYNMIVPAGYQKFNKLFHSMFFPIFDIHYLGV